MKRDSIPVSEGGPTPYRWESVRRLVVRIELAAIFAALLLVILVGTFIYQVRQQWSYEQRAETVLSIAHSEMAEGRPHRAMLVALEALPAEGTGLKPVEQVYEVLQEASVAANSVVPSVEITGSEGEIDDVEFDKTNRFVLVRQKSGRLKLLDTAQLGRTRPVQLFSGSFGIGDSVALSIVTAYGSEYSVSTEVSDDASEQETESGPDVEPSRNPQSQASEEGSETSTIVWFSVFEKWGERRVAVLHLFRCRVGSEQASPLINLDRGNGPCQRVWAGQFRSTDSVTLANPRRDAVTVINRYFNSERFSNTDPRELTAFATNFYYENNESNWGMRSMLVTARTSEISHEVSTGSENPDLEGESTIAFFSNSDASLHFAITKGDSFGLKAWGTAHFVTRPEEQLREQVAYLVPPFVNISLSALSEDLSLNYWKPKLKISHDQRQLAIIGRQKVAFFSLRRFENTIYFDDVPMIVDIGDVITAFDFAEINAEKKVNQQTTGDGQREETNENSCFHPQTPFAVGTGDGVIRSYFNTTKVTCFVTSPNDRTNAAAIEPPSPLDCNEGSSELCRKVGNHGDGWITGLQFVSLSRILSIGDFGQLTLWQKGSALEGDNTDAWARDLVLEVGRSRVIDLRQQSERTSQGGLAYQDRILSVQRRNGILVQGPVDELKKKRAQDQALVSPLPLIGVDTIIPSGRPMSDLPCVSGINNKKSLFKERGRFDGSVANYGRFFFATTDDGYVMAYLETAGKEYDESYRAIDCQSAAIKSVSHISVDERTKTLILANAHGWQAIPLENVGWNRFNYLRDGVFAESRGAVPDTAGEMGLSLVDAYALGSEEPREEHSRILITLYSVKASGQGLNRSDKRIALIKAWRLTDGRQLACWPIDCQPLAQDKDSNPKPFIGRPTYVEGMKSIQFLAYSGESADIFCVWQVSYLQNGNSTCAKETETTKPSSEVDEVSASPPEAGNQFFQANIESNQEILSNPTYSRRNSGRSYSASTIWSKKVTGDSVPYAFILIGMTDGSLYLSTIIDNSLETKCTGFLGSFGGEIRKIEVAPNGTIVLQSKARGGVKITVLRGLSEIPRLGNPLMSYLARDLLSAVSNTEDPGSSCPSTGPYLFNFNEFDVVGDVGLTKLDPLVDETMIVADRHNLTFWDLMTETPFFKTSISPTYKGAEVKSLAFPGPLSGRRAPSSGSMVVVGIDQSNGLPSGGRGDPVLQSGTKFSVLTIRKAVKGRGLIDEVCSSLPMWRRSLMDHEMRELNLPEREIGLFSSVKGYISTIYFDLIGKSREGALIFDHHKSFPARLVNVLTSLTSSERVRRYQTNDDISNNGCLRVQA